MDARFVEAFLETRLKRQFGRSLGISIGPPIISKFSGMRPEVYLHVKRLEDFNGIAENGAKVSRRPYKGESTFKGIAEERPGRLILLVYCLADSYALLQEICRELSPSILLALELLPRIPLGSLIDESSHLHFDDFTSCLHQAELDRSVYDDIAYYEGLLEFHLNGFIHVVLSKKGGLKNKPSRKKPVTKKLPKPVTAKRATKKKVRSRKKVR